VLDELKVHDAPIVTAWNKIDAAPNPDGVRALAHGRRDTVSGGAAACSVGMERGDGCGDGVGAVWVAGAGNWGLSLEIEVEFAGVLGDSSYLALERSPPSPSIPSQPPTPTPPNPPPQRPPSPSPNPNLRLSSAGPPVRGWTGCWR